MGTPCYADRPLFLWSSIVIFVTVGSQLPFDRLIIAVDEWAKSSGSAVPVFAQIGISTYKPQNIDYCQTMTPDEYQSYLEKADLIISHAGMGTIISALELGKTLLLMPRLASHSEHRNDHQLATLKNFSHFANIVSIKDETELAETLNNQLSEKKFYSNLETEVYPALINAIKEFINPVA